MNTLTFVLVDRRKIGGKVANNWRKIGEKLANNWRKNTDDDISVNEIKILTYLYKKGSITSSDVVKLLGVKNSRARGILSQMFKKGLIEKIGKTKGTYYILKSDNKP